jgi:hypothetical protein
MRKAKNWDQPCPTPAYNHYKLMNHGNVRSIATYPAQSSKRRCRLCGEQFSETHQMVFFDLHPSEKRVILVLKFLLCKVELSSLSLCPLSS